MACSSVQVEVIQVQSLGYVYFTADGNAVEITLPVDQMILDTGEAYDLFIYQFMNNSVFIYYC